MMIISYREGDTAGVLSEAAEVLKRGGIIAYATESFYALGVLATDEGAVSRLFRLKKRPVDKPLPVIISDAGVLASIVKNVPAGANNLMDTYWPGPLTLIFEGGGSIPDLLTGNSGKVAVRVPGESAALDLVRGLKMPITATSANLSGEPPAADADAVINCFGGNIDLIIDSGPAPGGRPSTILDVTVSPPLLLREGRIKDLKY